MGIVNLNGELTTPKKYFTVRLVRGTYIYYHCLLNCTNRIGVITAQSRQLNPSKLRMEIVDWFVRATEYFNVQLVNFGKQANK